MIEKTYYEAKRTGADQWTGRLYGYVGDREVTIKAIEADSEGEAVDAIVDWAEQNDYDAELA